MISLKDMENVRQSPGYEQGNANEIVLDIVQQNVSSTGVELNCLLYY